MLRLGVVVLIIGIMLVPECSGFSGEGDCVPRVRLILFSVRRRCPRQQCAGFGQRRTDWLECRESACICCVFMLFFVLFHVLFCWRAPLLVAFNTRTHNTHSGWKRMDTTFSMCLYALCCLSLVCCCVLFVVCRLLLFVICCLSIHLLLCQNRTHIDLRVPGCLDQFKYVSPFVHNTQNTNKTKTQPKTNNKQQRGCSVRDVFGVRGRRVEVYWQCAKQRAVGHHRTQSVDLSVRFQMATYVLCLLLLVLLLWVLLLIVCCRRAQDSVFVHFFVFANTGLVCVVLAYSLVCSQIHMAQSND